MKKINFLPKNNKECEEIFGIIKLVVFITFVCLLILALLGRIHWVCPVLAGFFYVWNIRQYQIGSLSHVIHDGAKRGYPRKGLYRVYQSWRVFAIIVILTIIAVIVTP